MASSTYLTSDMEHRDEAVAFQSRTDVTEAGTELDSNLCAYCLKRSDKWRECRSYVNGKPSTERPPGIRSTRKFPPLQNGGSNQEKRSTKGTHGHECGSRRRVKSRNTWKNIDFNVGRQSRRGLESLRLGIECSHDSLERGSQEHA